MTRVQIRETAKIYQFPKKNIPENRDYAISNSTQVIYESGAGSWYHEEAIREAEEAKKQ